MSFSDFIKEHNVRIPRIQRDYTYGSGTKKTEEVVEKILNDIKKSLEDTDSELILDFVYGSNDFEGNYSPLDGQQRLTTLFLLQLFALWNSDQNKELVFHYATRDNTEEFCKNLTDPKIFKYDPEGEKISEQIKDSSLFRTSFNDDPSILSMLVVLDKIEHKFKDLAKDGVLFDLLENNCRIKFFCLDFGNYGRADDLYIKMNSRGKALTDYEIFKSQIEKYIEVNLGDKELKYEFAKKFDTLFTDLVWSELNYNLEDVDKSFVNLIRNILWLRNFKRGNTKYLESLDVLGHYLPPEDYEEREVLPAWYLEKEDIRFIIDFLDAFYKAYEFGLKNNWDQDILDNFWNHFLYKTNKVRGEKTNRVRLFSQDVNLFKKAFQSNLTNAERLMLYVQYYILRYKEPSLILRKEGEEMIPDKEVLKNLRHIRNLIENSENEIPRPEYIAEMLTELEQILDGNIQTISDSKFNTLQFEEEKIKEPDLINWEPLFYYEDHNILRGALSLLSFDDNKKVLDLKDSNQYDLLKDRLSKVDYIFDNSSEDGKGQQNNRDHYIRALLLSKGDFGQISRSDIKYSRDNYMYGCLPSSWRNLLTRNSNFDQNNILKLIDNLDISAPLIIEDLPTTDWRYYASHPAWYNQTYYSYNQGRYGYYYIREGEDPIEMYILQSTSSNNDNVMWKLLNWLLEYTLRTRGVIEEADGKLGNRQTAPELYIFGTYYLNVKEKGWQLGNEDFLNEIRNYLIKRGYLIQDDVVIVPPDWNYIEYGVKLVRDINKYLERKRNYYPLATI